MKKSMRALIEVIAGLIIGAFAAALAFFILSWLLQRKRKGKENEKGSSPTRTIYSPLIKKHEDLAFLEKEDGLASVEIIGKGGCGEVYKAALPGSNGKMIAIKKVKLDPKEEGFHNKMKQIESEIKTVGQIRHRNLVPLLAHISTPDCHYLVYEFMKNGSLDGMLKGEMELDWLSRHKIALGIAAGLEYLHKSHSPRIIHRDLKPANILLDDDMEARISDFGLAEIMPEAHTHVTASKVSGTRGYKAPEYDQMCRFSDKSDIFSFGVTLAVLVIGKPPADMFFCRNCTTIVYWMRDVMASETRTIAIDSRLMGNGYEEQMLLVLKIACFCTVDTPKERPDISEVRCMLSQINH